MDTTPSAFEMLVQPLLEGLALWFLILAAGQSLVAAALRLRRGPVEQDDPR